MIDISKKFIFLLISILLILYPLVFYKIFFSSPEDYLHGAFVKIMYIHVPSAWLGIGIYVVMGLLNFLSLSLSMPILGLIAYALAPIGISFTAICLITGSLWGKPIWGAFWVWDARLTSMLILLVLYLGYYLVWNYKAFHIKVAALVNIIGLVNIPIIKFSVDIWATLHQKSSLIRSGGIAIHSSMLEPLLLMFFLSVILTLVLWYFNIKALLNFRKINRLLLHEKFTYD
jgi:heme exporter protein C